MIQKTLTLAGKSALGWFPADYDPTKAYNFEVFLPGSGEMNYPGTSKLLLNGPGAALPSSDPGAEMVVIAIEPDEPYEPYFNEPGTYVKAIMAAYKVNKIYPSGLSYGCQDWLNWFFQPGQDLSMIGGLFMLSPDPTTLPQYGGPAMDYTLFQKNGIFLYCGVGTNDGFIKGVNDMTAGVKAAGGTAYVDLWPGAGHGNPVWSDFWSTGWVSQALAMGHYKFIAAQQQPASAPVVTVPPFTSAGIILTTATPAQLATIKPLAPTVYIHPVTKAITVWDGKTWQ